jgi:hypothetical protein
MKTLPACYIRASDASWYRRRAERYRDEDLKKYLVSTLHVMIITRCWEHPEWPRQLLIEWPEESDDIDVLLNYYTSMSMQNIG